MPKFILATKQNMVQFFSEGGKAFAATLLNAGPVVVINIKTAERDGYFAAQVGYGNKKKIAKPQQGQFKNLGNFRYVKEFSVPDAKEIENIKLGTTIDVSIFKEGDIVAVSGTSKGKGFQGVVKRHGFHGGSRTHGQKHSEREPGSIGGGGRAGGRVVKGMRMAGRMGGERITVKNLKILAIDKENNQLLVSGAVPGKRGTLLEIRSANLEI